MLEENQYKTLLLFIVSFLIGAIVIIFYAHIVTSRNADVSEKIKSPFANFFSVEKPPNSSLKGKVVLLSGTVDWTSRVSTVPATLKPDQLIQQGEGFITRATGKLGVLFEKKATFALSPDSEVYLAQTLPENFVFQQKLGTANYANFTDKPLSVRALHLLTELTNGAIVVTVDPEEPMVSVYVDQGTVKVAYNNAENVSTVMTIPEGRRLIFNDEERIARLR